MFSVSAVLSFPGVWRATENQGTALPAPSDASQESVRPKVLRLGDRAGGRAALDAVLPDGGLPRGAVVELSSPHALGAVTSLALAACAAAQREARFRSGDERTLGAMCGFVDPWETLYAPALARHAVDSTRLIVVRPPLGNLARVAVRMAESKAFSVLSIDLKGVPGACTPEGREQGHAQTVALERWSTVVRRLAIAIEHTDTTVLLLTDRLQHRAMPLPVALRLEVDRAPIAEGSDSFDEAPLQWLIHVAKDRLGRVSASFRASASQPIALSG